MTSTAKSLMPRAVLAVALVAVLALMLCIESDADSSRPERVCFPATEWNTDDSLRPCAEVVRVFEDGSVRVRVTDAGGDVRYVAGIGALDR